MSAVTAVTITKHLEYVAELEAQLHGSPYYDVAEHTAALAKSALETELVRLDDTADTADTTDTWTTHIKTLEWLLKFPTMSLTFDTFKTVLHDANIELVQLFLKLTDIDPSADDNYAIRIASHYGQTDVVKLLLVDPRVDPCAKYNSAIRIACRYGNTDVVKVLLADVRVDPSADNNFAIRTASRNGHAEVVKVLLEDPRLSPDKPIPSVIDNNAIRMANYYGHTDVVDVLDPSAIISQFV